MQTRHGNGFSKHEGDYNRIESSDEHKVNIWIRNKPIQYKLQCTLFIYYNEFTRKDQSSGAYTGALSRPDKLLFCMHSYNYHFLNISLQDKLIQDGRNFLDKELYDYKKTRKVSNDRSENRRNLIFYQQLHNIDIYLG